MKYKCPVTEAWSTQSFRKLKCTNGHYLINKTESNFKMRLFVVLSLLCVVGITVSNPASTYTDKWDNINLDEILESDRLLKGYVDCLMDRGRCTADGKTLKETMPDALEHECNKCTAKQKEGADKVIKHLVNKRPDLWKELGAKYDPNNIYLQRYKEKIDGVKENNKA